MSPASVNPVAVAGDAARLGKSVVAFRLAAAAERLGLGVCVWRDRESFPVLAGFDLDLVGPRGCEPEFGRLLRSECSEAGWEVLQRISRGPVTTFLLAAQSATPGDDDEFLQVDLHTGLTARGLPYLTASGIMGRSEVQAGIRWLDSTDAAMVSWLEPLLAGVAPKPRYREALETAVARDPERAGRLLADAVGRRLAARLVAGGSGAVTPVALRRAFVPRALLRRPGETLAVLTGRLRDTVRNLVFPPGRLWVVVGPDGAGKSAVIERLPPLVERRLALAVTRFHTRPYLIPRLARLLPLGRRRRAAALGERRYEKRPGRVTSALRFVLTLLDYTVGYWVRVRPRLARGHLVVFDRYIHDYLVDPRLRGIDLPRGLLHACFRLVPAGDRRIHVMSAPATLARRKSELAEPEAATQLSRYRELLAADPGGFALETDDRDAAASARVLAALLLRDLGRRVGGVAS